MTRRISLGRDAVMKLRQLLASRQPFAYCDSCLAIEMEVRLTEAKAAARTVGSEPGFTRRWGHCEGCGQTIELTSMRRGAM
jgi:hypothetical protein